METMTRERMAGLSLGHTYCQRLPTILLLMAPLSSATCTRHQATSSVKREESDSVTRNMNSPERCLYHLILYFNKSHYQSSNPDTCLGADLLPRIRPRLLVAVAAISSLGHGLVGPHLRAQ